MDSQLDDNKIKALFHQVLMEAIEEKRDSIRELLVEVVEDTGLIHAIQKGEHSGVASREEIFKIFHDAQKAA
jgi:hypothetical protein